MTQKRGFAAMTPDQRLEAQRRGGESARDRGTAYRWTSAAAKKAHRKGLAVRRAKGKRTS